MKKHNFSVLGMSALVLALSLVFAGCTTTQQAAATIDGGETSNIPKTIVITDFDRSEFTNVWDILIYSSQEMDWPPFAAGINDQDENIYYVLEWTKHWEDNWRELVWTGTGEFYIVIQCDPAADPSKDGANYVYSEDGINPTPVDIINAETTLEWSKFIWHSDYTAG